MKWEFSVLFVIGCLLGEDDGLYLTWMYLTCTTQSLSFSSVFSPFRVQHMDLSNSVIDVSTLHGILSLCSKLQNLSLEGLQLSDPIVK